MTTLNMHSNLRNYLDDLQLYGAMIAFTHDNEELHRLCATNSVLYLGKAFGDSKGRIRWQTGPYSNAYKQETYTATYIVKLGATAHSNLLFGCPCTGTFMLFDPWGREGRVLPEYHKAVEALASGLHDVLKKSFVPEPAFSYHGLQACPEIGPQPRERQAYKNVGISNDQKSPGLCTLWTLFVLRALLESPKPATLETFIQVQSVLVESIGSDKVGLHRLAAYCQELLNRYGRPTDAEVRKCYRRDSKIVPKRMTAEQKRVLVPRFNDPFDMQTSMSLAKKIALRSFGGPTIPRDFEVAVNGKPHDMRQIFFDSKMNWEYGKVKVKSGPFGLFRTPLTSGELQRTTWTLACSALNLLPVPGVFFTLTSPWPLFDFELAERISSMMRRCTSPLHQVQYDTKYARFPEREWLSRLSRHEQAMRVWENGRSVVSATTVTMAAAVPLGMVAGILSGGLLLPFMVGVAGGIVGDKVSSGSKPVAPNRDAFDKQVAINLARSQAANEIKFYVSMKCIIHALLLVLNVRLARLPENLRIRLDFSARTAGAVRKDLKDGRLQNMLSKLQECRPEIQKMNEAQLGRMATLLCWMIIRQ